VQSAQVSTTTATKFQNSTVWSVVYLTIDGVQEFPSAPQGISPGAFYQFTLGTGSHTYEAHTGYWNGSSRFELYVYKGSFTQASGVVGTVTLSNPTIQQLLTEFQSTGSWSGEWWGSDLSLHMRTFRFSSGGTFSLWDDSSSPFATGTYTLISYTEGVVTFRVTYSTGSTYDGTLDEIYGYFYMQNGPSSWTTIQYTYQGP